MDKENGVNVRVTRARARALKESSRNEQAVVVGLKDVTNISAKSHKRIYTSNFEVYTYINTTHDFYIIIIMMVIVVIIIIEIDLFMCVF